jgi:protein phosphatase
MQGLELQYFSRSEKGKRDNNEDAFLAEKIGDYWLFAVADGLGGHMAGEKASTMAVKILREEVAKGITDPKTSLEEIALKIHGEIQRQAETDRNCYGMVTTLLAALVNNEGKAWIMNIGDSRAYLISDTIRHTRDQSVVENLITMGEITREQARHHQTMILQALGDPESNIRWTLRGGPAGLRAAVVNGRPARQRGQGNDREDRPQSWGGFGGGVRSAYRNGAGMRERG